MAEAAGSFILKFDVSHSVGATRSLRPKHWIAGLVYR